MKTYSKYFKLSGETISLFNTILNLENSKRHELNLPNITHADLFEIMASYYYTSVYNVEEIKNLHKEEIDATDKILRSAFEQSFATLNINLKNILSQSKESSDLLRLILSSTNYLSTIESNSNEKDKMLGSLKVDKKIKDELIRELNEAEIY